jgi:hypothetical protein
MNDPAACARRRNNTTKTIGILAQFARWVKAVFPSCTSRCVGGHDVPQSRIMEISSFLLSYVESDPHTHQPSACIYVKPAGGLEMLITGPSLTFNELDCEIRRLHAELDEIRARARKKFYKADAASAS